MTARRVPVAFAVALLVLAGAVPATARTAGSVAADIAIGDVRLTDRLVLRIETTYVCPAGYAVPLSSPPRAEASQQGETGGSSQHKTLGDDLDCDGTPHRLLVRFPHARYGGAWAYGLFTQVSVSFEVHRDDPFSSVAASDLQMATIPSGPPGRASVAADIEIERAALSQRGVLRIRAGYVCPDGFAVAPTLPATASARQQTIEEQMRVKTFDGVECDGTPHAIRLRFAHPGSPRGAEWQRDALTSIRLSFQANVDDPYLYVLTWDVDVVVV